MYLKSSTRKQINSNEKLIDEILRLKLAIQIIYNTIFNQFIIIILLNKMIPARSW